MKLQTCAVVIPIFEAKLVLERPFDDKIRRLNIPESRIGGRDIEIAFGNISAIRSKYLTLKWLIKIETM